MKIYIPNNFLPERKYIVTTIFNDFLGYETDVSVFEQKDYRIVLNNGNEIIVKDDFWSGFDEEKGYLDEKNIPGEIIYSKNKFTPEKDIVAIYGNNELQISDKKIICGIDIFASAFFMLSRWEEYVKKERDKHQRFPDALSLAQKQGFYYRPIVNEYLEMLVNMLNLLGCKQERKEHDFEIIPTHDVDFLFKYSNLKDLIRTIGGHLLKRKSISLAFESVKEYYKSKNGKANDPFDTFDFLMDISEKNNVKSRFYFIAGKRGEYDVRYDFFDVRTRKIIQNIIDRGHIIGIHGSYNSFNNQEQFEEEIGRFNKYDLNVKEGRQHYLRFNVPSTWGIWSDANMKYDSTVAYANDGGFRAGVCYDYPVFDVLKRKMNGLREMPLIAMDVAIRAKSQDIDKFAENFLILRETVKKYKGKFVFLWHQNNFNTYLWKDLKSFYPQIFE